MRVLPPLARIRLAAKAAVGALRDPYLRGDLVAVLGETTGTEALKAMRSKMRQDPIGQRILADRPTLSLSSDKIDQLRSLPVGTLGAALVNAMDVHDINLGTRDPVLHVVNEELAYVMQRYRETHDMLHIVLGMPFSVSGEVGAKWFEMVHTGLPMAALAAAAGPIRMETGPSAHGKEYIIWAANAAKQSKFFMNVYFEEAWDTPLSDLRAEMQLPHFPSNRVARLDMAWTGEDPQPLIDHYKAAVAQIDVPQLSDMFRPFQRTSNNASSAAKAEDARKRARVFEHAIEWLEIYRASLGFGSVVR